MAAHLDGYADRKYADKVRIAKRAGPLDEYPGPGREQFARQTKKAAEAQRDRRVAQFTTRTTGRARSLLDGLG